MALKTLLLSAFLLIILLEAIAGKRITEHYTTFHTPTKFP